jgi:aspartate-semialdehyde dehydrogenase
VEEFSVEKVRTDNDFVFLAVSGDFALKYASEIAAGDGPIVIDNSSAFRYFDHIPLVVMSLLYPFQFTYATGA